RSSPTCLGAHPVLHSFPTRRSSDLKVLDRPESLEVDPRGDAASGPLVLIAVVDDASRTDSGERRLELDVLPRARLAGDLPLKLRDRKSTRLNSSHVSISYAVFCLKK